MIKIAIYDDSTIDNTNHLSSLVSQFFLSKDIPYCITAFDNSFELLTLLKTEALFDIALIAIIIPDLSFDMILSNQNGKCVLIFTITQNKSDLQENPEYTFDFLMYPASQNTIFPCLEKNLVHLARNRQHIPIKVKGNVHKLPSSKIVFIESSKHYLFFHLSNGTILRTYAKLDEYENILSGYGNFMRCHQSFIVNMDFIRQLRGRDFILDGGIHIPVRKSGFSLYKKKYIAYTLVKCSQGPPGDY